MGTSSKQIDDISEVVSAYTVHLIVDHHEVACIGVQKGVVF